MTETLTVYNVHDVGNGPELIGTIYTQFSRLWWRCEGSKQLHPKPPLEKTDPDAVIAEWRASLLNEAEEGEQKAEDHLKRARECRRLAEVEVKR